MKKLVTIVLTIVMLVSFAGCSKSDTIEISKKEFPEITGTDMDGNKVENTIFSEYDATIVNFWNNGCGTCIEEMPELEEYYKELSEENINLIGVASDSGESQEKFDFAKKVLSEKGVTYLNISPDISGEFYTDFLETITGYPTTFIVDNEGNIIGSGIVGNVKNQDEVLRERLNLAIK